MHGLGRKSLSHQLTSIVNVYIFCVCGKFWFYYFFALSQMSQFFKVYLERNEKSAGLFFLKCFKSCSFILWEGVSNFIPNFLIILDLLLACRYALFFLTPFKGIFSDVIIMSCWACHSCVSGLMSTVLFSNFSNGKVVLRCGHLVPSHIKEAYVCAY